MTERRAGWFSNDENDTPTADRERDLWEPWSTAGLHVGPDHDTHAGHPARETRKENR